MTRDEKLILVSMMTGHSPGWSRSIMAKAFSRLIRRGLVKTTRSKSSPRYGRNRIELTAAGRRAATQAALEYQRPATPGRMQPKRAMSTRWRPDNFDLYGYQRVGTFWRKQRGW